MKRQRLKPGLRVLAVVPDSSDPRLTRAERMALTVRNAATATGRCACGATVEGMPAHPSPGTYTETTMRHEDGCPAVSTAALRAARKLGASGRVDAGIYRER